MLGNYPWIFCLLIHFFKNYFRNAIRVTFFIKIRPDVLSILIWVQNSKQFAKVISNRQFKLLIYRKRDILTVHVFYINKPHYTQHFSEMKAHEDQCRSIWVSTLVMPNILYTNSIHPPPPTPPPPHPQFLCYKSHL